jgi:hypothetical protein
VYCVPCSVFNKRVHLFGEKHLDVIKNAWYNNKKKEVSVDILHPAAPISVDKYRKYGYKTHLRLYVQRDCH